VGEKHLDLFTLALGGDIGVGLGNFPGQVAGTFKDGARNSADGYAGTTPGFERASLAVEAAGAITHEAVLIDAGIVRRYPKT